MMASTIEVLSELQERMVMAKARLNVAAEQYAKTGDTQNSTRLSGKAEGMGLCLSYLHETIGEVERHED